jgi:hypothetical protein
MEAFEVLRGNGAESKDVLETQAIIGRTVGSLFVAPDNEGRIRPDANPAV